MVFLIILLAIIVVLVVANIKIVPQAHAYVIERLGAYSTTWSVGLHIKIPLIERVANKVTLKEQVVDFPPQPVITKDNVTMQIDTVVYYQITDPMRSILDEATDPWGIKVNRVELKNIIPPAGIREAMEKQMKAERERREAILRAEGEKKSAILVAEGVKESRILEAEAEKAAQILKAEADKEAAIRIAEGDADAIRNIQQATADGIRMLNGSEPGEAVLTIKSLEAFVKAADGKATKIILPSQIQGIAGLATTLKEVMKD